ncbi:MAG: ATP-dependent DNA helicase RecG [Parcubacteria group bacterium]|nr:ATP-dependent DNA helicase RecG [Parcubacteria group bacterium]
MREIFDMWGRMSVKEIMRYNGAMLPDDELEKHFRLVKTQKAALARLGLKTICDLFYHFPARYGEVLPTKNIAELKKGDEAVIRGRISKLEKTKAWRKKIPLTRAVVEDASPAYGGASGTIRVVWFHQPYLAEMMKEGMLVELRGKVTEDKKGLYLANPTSEAHARQAHGGAGARTLLGDSATDTEAPLESIYPESRGVTSRWFFYALKRALAAGAHKKIPEYIPDDILKKYHLPSLRAALVWIHQPKNIRDAEAARKRFAFEEVFFIQLARQKARRAYKANKTFPIRINPKETADFIKRFPFELTHSQRDSVHAIFDDFRAEEPMTRLLEGDVGSGKTAVAAVTAYAVVTSRPENQTFGNLQAAVMAPTEILAKQHFESFIELFSHLPIQIGLITGSGCYKFPSKVNSLKATNISRTQLLKWVANGEIPILIGTHALIQKHVVFKDLAYVVIDEQHRFGTMQRFKLVRKDARVPHLLSMTATPIPRTLALTIYGDLDLTLLTEMPKGRKPVITEIVPPNRRKDAYEKVRAELKAGRQAYVICPRIDEPDPEKERALLAKSVTEEAKRLKQDVFPEFEIEILHSKVKPKERDLIMQKFLDRQIDILVATSVIEVGVNVPNATVVVIEGAERFGLAQLHQLRGRVLRSTHQAYCYAFPNARGGASLARLRALKDAKNGFELAELDLKLRGAGELSGGKQWGISDLGMEAIQNLKMVEAAREEAGALLRGDPALTAHPSIGARIADADENVHWE